MNAGLLLGRLVFGALMAAHGSQKLFAWFGGYGIAGTGGFLESLGFRPGRRFAIATGLSELLGGLLLAAGFLQPVGAAAIVAVMTVAIVTVHWRHGLLAASNGVELPLLYTAAAAGLAFTGPGAYSLDALFGLARFWTAWTTAALLALGMLGAVVSLTLRRPQPVTSARTDIRDAA